MTLLSLKSVSSPATGLIRLSPVTKRRATSVATIAATLAATDHQLSVIIPAYNEETRLPKALAALADFLDSSGLDYRVVVADDGSQDATPRVAARFGWRFSTVRLAHNSGKGCAVRTAMLAATGQTVAFTDADLPYDLTALVQGHNWIEQNQCEVVLGSRRAQQLHGTVRRRLPRRLATRAFTEITRWLVSSESFDTQCGLKLFSRRSAIEIFSRSQINGFAFDAEVIMLALRLGMAYRSVPVTLVNEEASTVSLVRDALPMLFDVVRVRARLGNRCLTPTLREGWGRMPAARPRLAA